MFVISLRPLLIFEFHILIYPRSNVETLTLKQFHYVLIITDVVCILLVFRGVGFPSQVTSCHHGSNPTHVCGVWHAQGNQMKKMAFYQNIMVSHVNPTRMCIILNII